MASSGGTRAIIAAFLANLGIAIAKFVAFLFTASSSMLAESVHSMADTGNQGLLLFGGRQASRPPTETHPFGYGRERYFWAFVVSLVLFSLGSLFALYEGVSKIRDPHEIESPAWAFGVLGAAIVLEAFSMRTAAHESNAVRGGASWWGFVRHSKSPELPVVLLEDLGALIGLAVALGAVTLTVVTDEPRWDGYGTATIGVLLGVIAVVLALEMKSLLIGEAASEDDEALIAGAIDATPAAERLIHMRTQHIGPDELLVGAKIHFAAGLAVEELAAAIDSVEARIREVVPIATVIYVEPDVYRDGEATV
jgi:cation diffusion facilitator family transporter